MRVSCGLLVMAPATGISLAHKVSTGNGSAGIRTRFRGKASEQVNSGEYNTKADHRAVVCFYMAPATGIEPVTNP